MQTVQLLSLLTELAVVGSKMASRRSGRLFLDDDDVVDAMALDKRAYWAASADMGLPDLHPRCSPPSSSCSSSSSRRNSIDLAASFVAAEDLARLSASATSTTSSGSDSPEALVQVTQLAYTAQGTDSLIVPPVFRLAEHARGVFFVKKTWAPEPTYSAEGRPLNFGVVVPGVYRSSYPQPHNYSFVHGLALKTIVTLVEKDLPEGYRAFISDNGIAHHIFNMKGTKKQEIPIETMKAILRLVLDRQNHPVLIHCNHGKHRTGCVVAAVRKVSGWELASITHEYRAYAAPKVRDGDIQYIEAFPPSTALGLFGSPPSLRLRAGTFIRLAFVACFVMLLWVVSGSKMSSPGQKRLKTAK